MMTPLEKALQEEGRVNYCDECEQFQIVGNAAYCKVDGKLIHPIMLTRGQGTGPAWNCKKRQKPIANADRIRQMSDEELAELIGDNIDCSICKKEVFQTITCPGSLTADGPDCYGCWLSWLKSPAEVEA